ncbi:MAG TPA: hypothetical protein VGY56_02535 [Verrucomicrobiae bacterium]|nr:hypothetical protein [Verrucomicrobiae bacterium]
MTQNDGDNGRLDFPNGFTSKPDRRARARVELTSLGDALAAAGVCDSSEPTAARARVSGDTGAMSISAALATGEQPQGALLLEAQGQMDLAIVESCARKLARRMIASGKEVNEDTIQDGIGAGVLALMQWRATGAGGNASAGYTGEWKERETGKEQLNGWEYDLSEPSRVKVVKTFNQAARVAWRAVVTEMSRDTLGDSIPLHAVSEDWLWHNAAQRDESRAERAARFKIERLAASRQSRLFRKLAMLPCTNRKRAEVIERVGNAASMMLLGMTVEQAATAAGFAASGKRKQFTAGDAFCRALRRLGFRIRGHARQISKADFAADELWPRSL